LQDFYRPLELVLRSLSAATSLKQGGLAEVLHQTASGSSQLSATTSLKREDEAREVGEYAVFLRGSFSAATSLKHYCWRYRLESGRRSTQLICCDLIEA
jgi:hypothetical protein